MGQFDTEILNPIIAYANSKVKDSNTFPSESPFTQQCNCY